MSVEKKNIVVVGYSGHAYVVIDAIYSMGHTIAGYCDDTQKDRNPYNLEYLGIEEYHLLKEHDWIVCIGDGEIRRKLFRAHRNYGNPINVIHNSAVLGFGVEMGVGVFVSANVVINALVKVGNCAIINTGAIVEHECVVGDFSHIAPGAVLAGNVQVGSNTFVGANATVKQGVTIGNDVIIGAGSVVIRDIPNGVTVVGNPGRVLGGPI